MRSGPIRCDPARSSAIRPVWAPYGEPHLDEEVAFLMVEGFGGVLTRLTDAQATYINVPVKGPFKKDSYKY